MIYIIEDNPRDVIPIKDEDNQYFVINDPHPCPLNNPSNCSTKLSAKSSDVFTVTAF